MKDSYTFILSMSVVRTDNYLYSYKVVNQRSSGCLATTLPPVIILNTVSYPFLPNICLVLLLWIINSKIAFLELTMHFAAGYPRAL